MWVFERFRLEPSGLLAFGFLVFGFLAFARPLGSVVAAKSRISRYFSSFLAIVPFPKESQSGPEDAPAIFTIGHSTHELARFLDLLRTSRVECVVDVRRYPRSRRMPHFSKDALEESLSAEGLGYVHLVGLGGRRRALTSSPNTGWTTSGFRGYADHMASAEFEDELARVEAIARRSASALMCAEALWWRCHRRLVADALVARGWRVTHIGADGRLEHHSLTPFAAVMNGRVMYPADQLSLG